MDKVLKAKMWLKMLVVFLSSMCFYLWNVTMVSAQSERDTKELSYEDVQKAILDDPRISDDVKKEMFYELRDSADDLGIKAEEDKPDIDLTTEDGRNKAADKVLTDAKDGVSGVPEDKAKQIAEIIKSGSDPETIKEEMDKFFAENKDLFDGLKEDKEGLKGDVRELILRDGPRAEMVERMKELGIDPREMDAGRHEMSREDMEKVIKEGNFSDAEKEKMTREMERHLGERESGREFAGREAAEREMREVAEKMDFDRETIEREMEKYREMDRQSPEEWREPTPQPPPPPPPQP